MAKYCPCPSRAIACQTSRVPSSWPHWLVLVILRRRRIADEEENLRGVLQRARVLRPTGLRDAVRQRAAHVFGRVAAAVRVIIHERRIDLIKIARERQHSCDVLVADITIRDETDAHCGVCGRLHHLVDDAPDALLPARSEEHT